MHPYRTAYRRRGPRELVARRGRLLRRHVVRAIRRVLWRTVPQILIMLLLSFRAGFSVGHNLEADSARESADRLVDLLGRETEMGVALDRELERCAAAARVADQAFESLGVRVNDQGRIVVAPVGHISSAVLCQCGDCARGCTR